MTDDELTQKWAAERAASVARMAALAAGIAAELDDGWTVKPPREEYNEPRDLIRTDGAQIHLSIDRDRLNIGGSMHANGRHGSDSYLGNHLRRETMAAGVTSISVSATRPAAAIAKEIKRRLLPSWLALRAEGLARLAETDKSKSDAYGLACDIARILEAPQPRREDGRGYHFYARNDYAHGVAAEITEHGSVKFELRVGSPERALKLAELLASAAQESEAQP